MLQTKIAPQLEAAQALFFQLYGAGDVQAWRAPARINLLGEHVDYVSYLPTASLPIASHEHEMVMLYRANERAEIRGASVNDRFPPFRFALTKDSAQNAATWQEYLYQNPPPAPHWQNYVKAAVFYAQHRYPTEELTGFDFVVTSTIPPQGGSSSSSALVVLAGAVFRELNDLPVMPEVLASESAEAEWYVGTRGGALDHTAICLSQRYHVAHLRYRNYQKEYLPLPSSVFRWITFFSHPADKGREVMLAYNERAAVARLFIPAWLREYHEDAWSLAEKMNDRDAVGTILNELPEALSQEEIIQQLPAAFAECQRAFPALVARSHGEPFRLRARALHHWGEMLRVEEAGVLLEQTADLVAAMARLGTLMNETHASLCDLYEVSTPLVNQLHDLLVSHPGVLGARLIGGGFGGNVLALTKEEHVESLIKQVQNEFYAPQQREAMAEGAVMISTPGDGVSKLF